MLNISPPEIQDIPFLGLFFSGADPTMVGSRGAPSISFTANPALGALAMGIMQDFIISLSYSGKSKKRLKEKDEALRWMYSRRIDHAFSFINICESYGISYEAARKQFYLLANPPKVSKKSASYTLFKKPKRVRRAVLNARLLNISTKRDAA